MNTKRYVLKKDLPTQKVGDTLSFNEEFAYYVFDNSQWRKTETGLKMLPGFPRTVVENDDGAWFEEVQEERPPLGIMPEWRWKEMRFEEVSEAINRYEYLNKEAPKEWRDEYYSLREWLQNRLSQQQRKTSETQAVKGKANDVGNEKDWEIVAFRMIDHDIIIKKDNGRFNGYTEASFLNDPVNSVKAGDVIIHSVRRKIDGEVFTIGDELFGLGYYSNETHKIASIRLVNNTIGLGYGESGEISIYSAKKIKPKPDTKERIEVVTEDNEQWVKFPLAEFEKYKYTEQDLEKAFNAAREVFWEHTTGKITYSNGDWSDHHPPKYMNAKDYINSLNTNTKTYNHVQ